MIKIRSLIGILCLILCFFIPSLAVAKVETASKDIRIYTLNCGNIKVHDMASFSDANFYGHQSMSLADPCFLVKHPQGWLLWDLGLGDHYVGRTVEDAKHGITISVPLSLAAQLKQLGLKPNDIKFVALSHAHFDHTGNAKLFSKATFLIQRAEYEFIQQKPLASSVAPDTFDILKNFHKQLLEGDYDVFGDGSVLILSTPGHTPGHQSLKVVLPQQGLILLSGDVYHTREAYENQLIPTFNTSRVETISSMARIDSILGDTHGRLIIQHDAGDFASLPLIPEYLN